MTGLAKDITAFSEEIDQLIFIVSNHPNKVTTKETEILFRYEMYLESGYL